MATTIEARTEAKIDNIQPENIVSNDQEIQNILDKVKDGNIQVDNVVDGSTPQKNYVKFSRNESGVNQIKYIESSKLNELAEKNIIKYEMLTQLGILKTETKISQETNNLQKEVMQGVTTTENQENTPQGKTNKEINKIIDTITLKLVAEERINKCNALRSGIQSHEGNNESRKQLKNEIGESIENMKGIIKDVNRLEKKGQFYNNIDEYKNRIGGIIYNYYSNWEPSRQMIVLGQRVPHINGFIDSERDARNVARYERRNQEHEQRMAEILKNPTLLHLLGDDQHALNQYYSDIINGHIEPSTHPFYTQHMQSFQQIEKISPELYGNIAPRMPGQITYNTYCQRDPQLYQQYIQNNNIVCRPQSFNDKIGKGFADMLSQAFPGINSDPRKRQAREKAGSIAALGGAVVLGFQFFKNLFSRKDKNPDKRRNVGLFGAGLLGVLNLDKVSNWVQDITGWHPAEKSRLMNETFNKYGFTDKQAMEITDRYIGAPVTTMSALHFIPLYELESEKIIEEKGGEFEFNYNKYEEYINKSAWDKSQKEQMLKYGQKLRDDKCVGAGLKAFGITTRDKFKSLFGSDKNKTLAQTTEVQEGRGKMVERVSNGANKELYNNGLRAKSPEAADIIISEYGNEQKSREEINKLMLGWMQRGLLELSTDGKPYTLNDMLNKPEYTSNIDLDKMTMKGFTNGSNEVVFNSYGELFETVYTTNKIKQIFEGRQDAKDATPFHVNAIGQIEFNNTERYELHKNETAVLSLKKLSELPTIKSNINAYNDYLNKWRLESFTNS